jgi:perosamine synthetase
MIPLSRPMLGPEEMSAVASVLASGQLAQGPRVEEFERAFAAYVGTRHAVAVSSGTEALRLALIAIGVEPGDEVVVPALTFLATASSVLMCGATPVVADVDERTYCLDAEAVMGAVSDWTRAVVPVHLYGHPADLDPLRELCEARGLALVEDAAQAHGARYRGRMVGSIGAAGCFSFYPTKNMTTGEGGMVTTDDAELAERVRLLRQHGQVAPYDYHRLGYNSRMTDIGAAIGLVQLGRLEAFNAARRRNAALLTEGLRGCVVTPEVEPWAEHVFHQYTVRAARRDGLRAHLLEHGVGSGVYYPESLSDVKVLRGKAKVAGSAMVAERLCGEVLSIPVHPGLSEADVAKVVAEVRAFYA